MKTLYGIALSALALWLTTHFFPQWLYYPRADVFKTLLDFLWAGLLLGVANAIIRPILLFLTLPLTLLTFGLFSLVVNTVILLLVAQFSSLDARGFGGAFMAALVLMVLSAVLHMFIKPPHRVSRSLRSR